MKKEFKDQTSEFFIIEDWHNLNFFVPITEHFETIKKEGYEPEFIIRGTAINETTTHNGHKYIAQELEKASTHLIGKKLLVDHKNEVDAIKGIVNKSWFNPQNRSIEFEGVVKDKNIKEMIKDGRLSDVSIGAYAKELIQEDDGSYIAKDLNIVELSFVAVPADSKANFAMAMNNSYSLKELLKEEQAYTCPDCGKIFSNKKDMEKHTSMHESSDIQLTERRDKMTEENLQEKLDNQSKMLEEATKELEQLRKEKRQNKVNEYKKLCTEKKVTEKDISKVAEETIDFLIEQLKEIKVLEKSEFKSVIPEKSEVTEDFVLERIDGQFAIWEMPNQKKIRDLHKSLPFFNK